MGCFASSGEKSASLGAARKALHRRHIGGYVEDAATPRAVCRGADFPCGLTKQPTGLAFRSMLRATAIALLCALAVSAQGGGSLVEVVPKDPDVALRYLLLRPAKTKPGRLYPFVLSLHGTGMTIEQYSRSARQVSTSDVPVFVAIPHHEKRVERLAPLHDNLLPKLLAVVDEVTAEYPIDRGRMFVHGLLARWPHIVAVCLRLEEVGRKGRSHSAPYTCARATIRRAERGLRASRCCSWLAPGTSISSATSIS